MIVYRIRFIIDNFRQLEEREQKSLAEYVRSNFIRFGALEDYEREAKCGESGPVDTSGQVFHFEWQHPKIDKFPVILEALTDLGKSGDWSGSTGVTLKFAPVSYSQTESDSPISSTQGKIVTVECHNSILVSGRGLFSSSSPSPSSSLSVLDEMKMNAKKLSGEQFEEFMAWAKKEEAKREEKKKVAEEKKKATEEKKVAEEKNDEWKWNPYDPQSDATLDDELKNRLKGICDDNTKYYQLEYIEGKKESSSSKIFSCWHEPNSSVFQIYAGFLWKHGEEHFDNFPAYLHSKIQAYGLSGFPNGIKVFSIDVLNDGNYTKEILEVCLKAAHQLGMKPPCIAITHRKKMVIQNW